MMNKPLTKEDIIRYDCNEGISLDRLKEVLKEIENELIKEKLSYLSKGLKQNILDNSNNDAHFYAGVIVGLTSSEKIISYPFRPL